MPVPATATPPQPMIVVPPSVKLTVPVGDAPVTVAVKVRLVPAVEGLMEVDSVVDDPTLLTTCENGALLDVALTAFPL